MDSSTSIEKAMNKVSYSFIVTIKFETGSLETYGWKIVNKNFVPCLFSKYFIPFRHQSPQTLSLQNRPCQVPSCYKFGQ